MNAGFESCVTFTLVFVTFAVTMCQGQGQTTCHTHSRPHQRGVCGVRLTQAHQNLCFLMSMRYPQLFPQIKRSESVSNIDRIYSIPLSVLADLDLKSDNWASYIFKRVYTGQSAEGADMPGAKTVSNHYGQESLTELPSLKLKASPTAELFRMLSKRSGGVQKRDTFGMVCDCCINECSTAQLATYC